METEDLLVLVLTQKRSFIRGIIKNSFKLLTVVTKNSILNEIGFPDLPLTIIEKFDFSFVLSFTDCWPAQMPPERDKKCLSTALYRTPPEDYIWAQWIHNLKWMNVHGIFTWHRGRHINVLNAFNLERVPTEKNKQNKITVVAQCSQFFVSLIT